jgi:hypothetical protein
LELRAILASAAQKADEENTLMMYFSQKGNFEFSEYRHCFRFAGKKTYWFDFHVLK